MANDTKFAFLKRPVVTGAAALALCISAFGAGQILSPHNVVAQAIKAEAPRAANNLPSFADLVEHVSPAVVAIDVTLNQKSSQADIDEELKQLPPEFRKFFKNYQDDGNSIVQGGGSGFFISSDGYIVTNNHVVDGATKITVTLKDGKTLNAKVIGHDERTDLAVIKVDGNNYSYVQFEPDTNVRVGDWVVAIGNPFGLGGSATAGIVSAKGREDVGGQNISQFIQIDAPINPGNSGGPTFDMEGRVIGVNTAIFSKSGGNIGIGFAIPASTAQRVTQQLMKGGSVSYGWLGVGITDLSSDLASSFGLNGTKGAIVSSVNAGSPAEKAGIKRGDAIIAYDGQSIDGASDLTRRVGQTPIGHTVKLDVQDAAGRKRVANVTIAVRPSEQQLAQNNLPATTKPQSIPNSNIVTPNSGIGINVTSLNDAARKNLKLKSNDKGVLIASVDKNSEAYQKGIRKGYAILEANGDEVLSPSQFASIIKNAKDQKKDSIAIYVMTDGGKGSYVPLQLN